MTTLEEFSLKIIVTGNLIRGRQGCSLWWKNKIVKATVRPFDNRHCLLNASLWTVRGRSFKSKSHQKKSWNSGLKTTNQIGFSACFHFPACSNLVQFRIYQEGNHVFHLAFLTGACKRFLQIYRRTSFRKLQSTRTGTH